MDPVTHALSGMAVRQLGFRRKAALFVLVLSSVAPDFDYITRLWGTDAFLRYHRGITHGIVALVIFPIIMGLVFRKKGGFFYYYALSFIAYGLHLAMDLTNQYGTRILAPLDWNRYSLGLTFVIDPWITLGLLACVILGRQDGRKAALIAFAVIVLITGYVAGRVYLKGEAVQFLKTKIDANDYSLYPLPNDLTRWWFVTKSGDMANDGFVDLFSRRVCIADRYALNNNEPAVAVSRKDAHVKDFLDFAEYPFPEVVKENGRTEVIWRDLSYSFLPGDRFTERVEFDKNEKITGSAFHF